MAAQQISKGQPWFERWIALDDKSAATRAWKWLTPPEFYVDVDNALNITITTEFTGIGPAVAAGKVMLIVERNAGTTDDPGAWMYQDTILLPMPVAGGPDSVVKVLGQNNAAATNRYSRGLLRLQLYNDDNTNGNYAFVRLRTWIDIEYADGSHTFQSGFSDPERLFPDDNPNNPHLWHDGLYFLDPNTGSSPLPGAWSWEMPAALFMPMNNNTNAYYTVQFEAMGPGAGSVKVDFQRSAIPTEVFAAWETMNSATTFALAREAAYKSIAFGQNGAAGDKGPMGYQRVRLYNTDTTAGNWAAVRVRIWSHVSGA